MKHEIVRKSDGTALHVRRDMWGRIIRPSGAYEHYKQLKQEGVFHPAYTWKDCCKAFRKKVRKMKIAKLSRKGSKKRIKRAR